MINFGDIAYLKKGSEIQRKAYQVLTENKIWKCLDNYTPVLAGTVPINLAVENSDLDIICFWKDKKDFIRNVKRSFARFEGFKIRTRTISGMETVLANFNADGFAVEVFGQNIPVREQHAYKHMIAEYWLLEENDETFRQKILKLKREGYKTEPAFGILLGIKTDPYKELLIVGERFESP